MTDEHMLLDRYRPLSWMQVAIASIATTAPQYIFQYSTVQLPVTIVVLRSHRGDQDINTSAAYNLIHNLISRSTYRISSLILSNNSTLHLTVLYFLSINAGC
jgi:hypothetical protein